MIIHRTVIRHRVFAAAVAVALGLRALVVIAYPQAFWFTDSSRYLTFSYGWRPDFIRQSGYSMLLKVLRHTGSLASVSLLQHLLGVASAVAVYALLCRRGVPRWLATLAAAPVLFDAFELGIEHFVLTETAFTGLLVAGLLALVWPAVPSARSAGVAGVLLALSVTFRAVSLPLVLLTVAYLVARRVGWRILVVYATCAAMPLLGYLVWFHHSYGTYGLSTAQGIFLYGRVAPFADCDRLRLTVAERAICPAQPVGVRPRRSDWYIWNEGSVGRGARPEVQQGFAVAVFTQQPGDMARVIAMDTGRYLVPHPVDPDWVCVTDGYLLPADPPGAEYDWCRPNPRQAFSGRGDPDTMPGPSTLTHVLGGYAQLVRTPRLVLGLSVLLVVTVLVWRPRRRIDGHRLSDVALLGGWGLGLLVLASATSVFDERYGLPTLAILPAAGALAAHRLVAGRGYRPAGPISPDGSGSGPEEGGIVGAGRDEAERGAGARGQAAIPGRVDEDVVRDRTAELGIPGRGDGRTGG